MSMIAWNEAKAALKKAREYIALIGKQQRTTVVSRGCLHSLAVKTQVYYQPTDGEKNYHECAEFDKAMSIVVRRHWHALHAEAIQDLEAGVSSTGRDARNSVQAMLDQIDSYEATQ